MNHEEASHVEESNFEDLQEETDNSNTDSINNYETHLEGAKGLFAGGDISIGKIIQRVFNLSINVAWPFNSQHSRFIRYVAVSVYITLLLGGLIKLWREDYASPFNLTLIITGTILIVLTCFYYAFIWKPSTKKSPQPPNLPVKPEILEDVRFWPDPNAEDPERDVYRYLAERQKHREEYELKLELRRESKKKYQDDRNQYDKECEVYENYKNRKKQRLRRPIFRRCVAVILMVFIPLFSFAGVWSWENIPTNTIVTFAEYYGDNPAQTNNITGSIREKLRSAIYTKDEGVTIKYIAKSFRNSEEEKAKREGEQRKATISIWGWYDESNDFSINTIFRLLKPSLASSISSAAVRLGVEDKDWFHHHLEHSVSLEEVDANIESDPANEISYLVNFTSGLAYYKARNWRSSIDRFNTALNDIDDVEKPSSDLSESIVYFYRSNALFYQSYFSTDKKLSEHKNGYEAAIDGFTKAIELIPEPSSTFHNQKKYISREYNSNVLLIGYEISQFDPGVSEVYSDQEIVCRNQKRDTNTLVGNSPSQFKAYLARAYYNRGLSHAVIGNTDKSLADYGKALQLDPEMDALCIGLAAAYAYQGKHDLSIQNLSQAINANPKDALAHNNLGNIYTAQGNYKKAISNYNIAAKLKPDSAGTFYNRGRAFLLSGGDSSQLQALSDFNRAIELSIIPNYIYFYERGNLFLAREKYEQAIEDFKEVVKLNPDFSEAYYLLGQVYLDHKNDYIKATQNFEEVAELQPSLEVELESKLADETVKSNLDRAINTSSNSPHPYYSRSLYLLEKGEFEEASNDFEKALQLTSSRMAPYLEKDPKFYEYEELEILQKDVERTYSAAVKVYEVAESSGLLLPNLVIYNNSDTVRSIILNRVLVDDTEERVTEIQLFPSSSHLEKLKTGKYRVSFAGQNIEIDDELIDESLVEPGKMNRRREFRMVANRPEFYVIYDQN